MNSIWQKPPWRNFPHSSSPSQSFFYPPAFGCSPADFHTHHGRLGTVQQMPLRRTFQSGTTPLFTLFILKYLCPEVIPNMKHPQQFPREIVSFSVKVALQEGCESLKNNFFTFCTMALCYNLNHWYGLFEVLLFDVSLSNQCAKVTTNL